MLHLSDADVEDAIEDGVVIIAAAGNDNYYVAEQADPEWNSRVNISGLGTVYFMRGSSPGAARGAINVGSLQPNNNKRSTFTNYGPGIDVFAPGSDIHSAFNNLVSMIQSILRELET